MTRKQEVWFSIFPDRENIANLRNLIKTRKFKEFNKKTGKTQEFNKNTGNLDRKLKSGYGSTGDGGLLQNKIVLIFARQKLWELECLSVESPPPACQ